MPNGKLIFEQSPYMVCESRPGVFHVVSEIEYKSGLLRTSRHTYKLRNLDDRELRLRKEIFETPTLLDDEQDYRVLITLQSTDLVVPSVINALRKIAGFSFHNYFGYIPYHRDRAKTLDEEIAVLVEKKDTERIYMFRPRLFRIKYDT
jgi:hypothetical protein